MVPRHFDALRDRYVGAHPGSDAEQSAPSWQDNRASVGQYFRIHNARQKAAAAAAEKKKERSDKAMAAMATKKKR